MNGITPEEAVAIATDAAFKHGRQHGYVTEPFQPHEWVVEAILSAVNGITSNHGQWDTLEPNEGEPPKFACPPHLYRVHPEDAGHTVAGSAVDNRYAPWGGTAP